MKRKLMNWLKAAVMAPLAAAYATGGCTANALRDTADVFENAANDIDGDQREVDLGDWLADELEEL